ncbi:MAG: sugar-binding protein [Bacteroidia bacterium]
MNPNLATLFTFLTCASLQVLFAQKADFVADSMHIVQGKVNWKSRKDCSATAKILCDGTAISILLQVNDDKINTRGEASEIDHVEIKLALPPSAYPPDFEYNIHPNYVYSNSDDPKKPPRFFSVYSEYANSLEVDNFAKKFDYPNAQAFKNNKLRVPLPSSLKTARIDYGVVHFGLFPDQRKAVQYNRNNYKLLESSLNLKLGDFTQGIRYVVQKNESGYALSATFSPQALGFVKLPKLEELRFLIEVFDKDDVNQKNPTILSTSNFRDAKMLKNLTMVRFRKPLKTNFTNIPDGVFNKLDFHPVYVYTDSTWQGTAIETDMLAYQEEKLSKSLIELKFSNLPINYAAFDDEKANTIKRLSLDKAYVNTKPKKVEYYIINGYVFESEMVKTDKAKEDILNQTFLFPDGTAGLILKIRTPVNEYNWGDCASCSEEVISILRVTKKSSKTILGIYQGNSGEDYCQIGNKNYKGYFVSNLDWLREGKILIIRLQDLKTGQKKRVKVTWRDDGSNVEIKE